MTDLVAEVRSIVIADSPLGEILAGLETKFHRIVDEGGSEAGRRFFTLMESWLARVKSKDSNA